MLTAFAASGCEVIKDPGASAAVRERTVNAGVAGDYAADDVYCRFRDQGFFVVRKQGQLFALSAICTHKKCKLSAESDRSFYCPCHGSTFDPDGRVTKGPARRDLPRLPLLVNDNGELLIQVPAL